MISLQKDGKFEFFVIEKDEDWSKMALLTINYVTIVGREEQYKEERLKKSGKKIKGRILDSFDLIHQNQIFFFLFSL